MLPLSPYEKSAHTWFTETPLFYLVDGYTSVFVFFVLSGFVLTGAFDGRAGQVVSNVVTRLVRLLIPVWVSLAFGFLMFSAMPDIAYKAAHVSLSNWLAQRAGLPEPSIGFLLREMFVNVPLVGYNDMGLFSYMPFMSLPDFVIAPRMSLNSPLWTLNCEILGSLLIILLCFLHARYRMLEIALLILMAAIYPNTPLFLFVVGYLSKRVLEPRLGESGAWWRGAVGLILLGGGIAIAASKHVGLLSDLWRWCTQTVVAPKAMSDMGLQSAIGAIGIFLGTLILISWRQRVNLVGRALNGRFCQLAGRYSFSIYLLHMPLVYTVASHLHLTLARNFGAAWAGPLTIALGMTGTALLAMAFHHWVDLPSIVLSRKVARRFPPVARPGQARGGV